MKMAFKKILIPFNFKPNDIKALDFASRSFAHVEDAEFFVFHAYTPVPELETKDSVVTGKLKSSLGYLNQRIKEQEAELNTAKQEFIKHGVNEDRVHAIFKPRKKDIAGEIVDLVISENFDVVVINHKHGRITRFLAASVFYKVVSALRDKTVCIVS
jgi:nucleotide-binding universal stress UspA family protein